MTLCRLAGQFCLALLLAVPAFAQGGRTGTSLSGIVTDVSGGVIPGATVIVKNNATNVTYETVSNEQGAFSVPALDAGTYTVTVSLQGFKTAVLNDVVLNAGVPGSVRARLEVGALEETIVVSGASEIIQTQTSAVATTLDVNQISKLPVGSRSVLDFVVNLPGVTTPGGSRNSIINGLPQSTINITIDGMSVQDNHLKTGDGFFARVSPRLDAVEEVTVNTAAQGAQATGQGAVQIQFVTRSGTNNFSGSSYYYLQHYNLNANTWFNNRDLNPDPATGKAPKPENILHQPGTRVGGPIVIPGLVDLRNKAFFFVNYEESRAPAQITREREILHPLAQQAIFRYNTSSGVREVNLLALAAVNGQTATIDPTIGKLLADIRAATGTTGAVADLTDPSIQRYTWQVDREGTTRYPTVKIDYNLTDSHRLSGSWNFTNLLSDPDTLNNRDPVFPGFPIFGAQHSKRYAFQTNLRSTFTSNLVNEFKVGFTGGATLFSPEILSQPWSGSSVANQGGFFLDIDTANIDNASNSPAYQAREASTNLIENTLNWIKGSHSLTMGGSWTEVDLWLQNDTVVPTLQFDIVSGDPANAMFSATNFPGSSAGQRSDAGDLYAVLTGRVSAIQGNARLNEDTDEYEYLGNGFQRARMREFGFFVSDTWRWKPNFTVNLGLRYEVQLPFYPLNNSYSTATMDDICGISGVAPNTTCNLFQPGVLTGRPPVFNQFAKGEHAYDIDWNNFAPNLGFAWTVGGNGGPFGAILGREQGDSVLRAGYSLAYSRNGTSDFSGQFGANPGVAITVDRNASLSGANNLNNDGRGLPVLLRTSERLAAPPFPLRQEYPYTEVITGDMSIFDRNLQVPYAQTWTAGWQRKLTADTAVEIRYVGTRHLQGWTEYQYNEANIIENGFLDEFRLAQANLQAHVAAGCGTSGNPACSFAYRGPGTGTSPLPIYLAYLNGRADAGNAAAYSGGSWTSSNFIDPLAIHNPNPFAAAPTSPTSSNAVANQALEGSPTRRDNAVTAGYPRNFFRVNPDLLGGVGVTGNGGYTKFNGLQLEFRKRLSAGLQFNSSYAYGRGYESVRYSFRTPRRSRLDTGTEGGVTHAFKANWVYELPFGNGRRFGSNVGPMLDRLIGGWSFDGIARIQSGRMLDFGNVRVVGMSREELQGAFKLRFDDANKAIYMLPQDIIDNTIRAFSVDATSPTGYGELGPPTGRYLAPANGPDCIETSPGFGDCGVGSLVVTGPSLVRFDLSTTKRIPIKGRVNVEFRAEMLNAFNTPWFDPVTGVGDDPDDYRVDSADSGRVVQLIWRVNW
jgi:hypothetical protein